METLEKKDSPMKYPIIQKNHHHTSLDGLFRYADVLDYGSVHVKFDHATGLKAIIAIHSLQRGPAIGGCRLYSYPSTDDALEDALRLGYMMSYKAAISNLNHGGAKSVILKPKIIKDRKAFFSAFGDFVNELGGRYITAVDSGTNAEDMDIIQTRTPFVTCTSTSKNSGDPSPYTAMGVRRGIEAALKFKFDKDSLEGIHVAIQGVGHVGYLLAKDLHKRGARLTVSDVNQAALQKCQEEFKAEICTPEKIYDVAADVFAPCALGSVLNLNTIKRLRVPIVVGSANNQLAHHQHGNLLHERGILYAPDFLVNSGGLIFVAAVYDEESLQQAESQVCNIYENLLNVFEQSKLKNVATSEIAENLAFERLKG